MKTTSINPFARGFTLIELLVVIGIIAILAGGVGLAMRNRNPGAALRAGQSSLVSCLSSARSQAALNQMDAMIIVQANTSDQNFLRSVKVVVEKTAGSNDWREVGTEFVLPDGVYVVPRTSGSFASTVITLEDTAKVSGFFETTGKVKLNGVDTTDDYMRSYKLTSLGSVSGGIGGYILVATGTPTSATNTKLDNGTAVRGLVVSKYGIATLVGDSSSL